MKVYPPSVNTPTMNSVSHSRLADLLAAVGRRLKPTFLIVGAQKSGTSALFRYLARHPCVAAPAEKELHFFDQEANYRQGPLWYHLHFPQRTGPAVTFEATPYYLAYPQAAERIHHYDPSLKLIVLLRNPIERAYSAWNMVYRLLTEHHVDELLRRIQTTADPNLARLARLLAQVNPEDQAGLTHLYQSQAFLSFAEAVHQEISRLQADERRPYPDFVQRGLYFQQLQPYRAYFPPQQLLILESRQLKEEPTATLHRVTHFLELPPHNWEQEDYSFTPSAYP
ncbi:MAG: sulfotransferase domain-containing protein, partial [Chloroflexota bacterium]